MDLKMLRYSILLKSTMEDLSKNIELEVTDCDIIDRWTEEMFSEDLEE